MMITRASLLVSLVAALALLGHAAGRVLPASPLLASSSPGLDGKLFLATCNLPACSTLSFAYYDLSTNTTTDVYDFPFDAFEDAYVADNVLVNTTYILSLQYDSDPSQGYLLSFDTATNKVVGGFNTTFCFNLFVDPSDLSGDTLLCLAVLPNCKGGSQCSELHRISISRQTDVKLSSFLPNYAPYTVSTMDTKRNIIYSAFAPLNKLGVAGDVLASFDAATGRLLQTVPFPPETIAFIELEYDAVTDETYAVIMQGGSTFFGTVNLTTAVGTPIGPKSTFDTSYWGQFNTISTLSTELGVFFTTAFHYEQPTVPILHLLGLSLKSGEIIYDTIVQNPFCEIAWLPS